MNTTEEDLRVANERIADWGFFNGDDPEVAELAKHIASALAAEREKAAKIAELDSVLSWVGGSTGSAKLTAENIARAIRANKE